MPHDKWRELHTAAAAGHAVIVDLPPGSELRRVKRAAGRPRNIGMRWSNYAGYDATSGKQPVCKLRGCSKRLRRDQPIACCDDHERLFHEHLDAVKEKIIAGGKYEIGPDGSLRERSARTASVPPICPEDPSR